MFLLFHFILSRKPKSFEKKILRKALLIKSKEYILGFLINSLLMHVAGMSHAGTRTKKELIAKSHCPILLEQHFSVKCTVYADIDEQCHNQTVRNKCFTFFWHRNATLEVWEMLP